MIRPRVIPCLLFDGSALVKTIQFASPRYVGDPVNVVQIFSEIGADEIVFLDIAATREGRSPDFQRIAEMASEAFVPMAYGGGVRTLEDAAQVLKSGVEKVVINSASSENLNLITQIAEHYGSQAVVGSIDAKRSLFGKYEVYSHSGTRKIGYSADEWAVLLEKAGAGEILLQSMDRDGTYRGYEVSLIQKVSSRVDIPVIACGGAASRSDLQSAYRQGASAVAAGSLFVFQGPDLGVLVNFPSEDELEATFL